MLISHFLQVYRVLPTANQPLSLSRPPGAQTRSSPTSLPNSLPPLSIGRGCFARHRKRMNQPILPSCWCFSLSPKTPMFLFLLLKENHFSYSRTYDIVATPSATPGMGVTDFPFLKQWTGFGPKTIRCTPHPHAEGCGSMPHPSSCILAHVYTLMQTLHPRTCVYSPRILPSTHRRVLCFYFWGVHKPRSYSGAQL